MSKVQNPYNGFYSKSGVKGGKKGEKMYYFTESKTGDLYSRMYIQPIYMLVIVHFSPTIRGCRSDIVQENSIF